MSIAKCSNCELPLLLTISVMSGSISIADIDAAITRASRSRKISVDGLSKEGPSLAELLKLRAECIASENAGSRQRSVLYQRMISSSGGA